MNILGVLFRVVSNLEKFLKTRTEIIRGLVFYRTGTDTEWKSQLIQCTINDKEMKT